MRRRVVWVAGLAAAAALSASCGSSSSSEEPGPPTAGAGALGAITIQAPIDGARLKARQSPGGGTLRARARVRGRAAAGREVFLSAGCRPTVCRARARVGQDGRWAVTLALKVPRAASFVTIDANARRDVVATGSAVATVELVGPARPAARQRATPQQRSSSSGDGASAPRAPSRPTLPRDVLVIGDSLAIGIEQPLQAALPGWRVRVDGRIGRPLAEGMSILGRQSDPPAILAFALFTNDGPRNMGALEAAVRATATRPGGCVVWSTVVRPPEDGVSYAAANTLLRGLGDDPELALGLELVDWAAAVSRSPSLVSPSDGVHATAEGYGILAELYAEAIQACAG